MEPSSIRREVLFPDTRESVWRALTESERLEEWFANEVELELRPGGEGVFRWADGSIRRATFDEVEPGRRLALRWREEDADDGETLVELTLEEIPEGTRLVVVESIPSSAPQASAGFGGDWSVALALVAARPPVAAR